MGNRRHASSFKENLAPNGAFPTLKHSCPKLHCPETGIKQDLITSSAEDSIDADSLEYRRAALTVPLWKTPEYVARRRRVLQRLGKTPPRPSYADKVKDIFASQSKQSKALPGATLGVFHSLKGDAAANQSHFAGVSPPKHRACDSGSDSTLTSVEELEKRLSRPANSPLKRRRRSRAASTSSTDPLGDLERAVDLAMSADEQRRYGASPTAPPQEGWSTTDSSKSLISPEIQEYSAAGESSDEWTGDDEFYPRVTRCQPHVAGDRGAEDAHPPASPHLDVPARAIVSFETPPRVAQSHFIKSPRSTRFSRVTFNAAALAETEGSPAVTFSAQARPTTNVGCSGPACARSNGRSSDADDEADGGEN